MAKIPLRSYLREIEDAIEEGQTDEAVQHCRHVLKVFPKHIDTYRLLGKAFLEAQRYGSAADIFQRVLSAIPDDFVSHVGMSIIREDEGNLDTSLWYMERAFEVQPYNPAIQGEVRRLYGKRDGMEPSKARLTRGALARTYAKGDHYEQSIAELRAALAEEPDRSDLQVMLAEMYAKTGENLKAIENCSLVLKNLPFCLPANRLLGNLLQGTDREDESKAYLQRVHALDPYEAHISSHALTADDVPEQAVTIDRMDWGASVPSGATDRQPEWAASLGVDMDDSDPREAGVPDWLAAASVDSPVSQGSEDLSPTDDEEFPEWMKDAGWKPSSGEFEDGPSPLSFDDQPAEDSGSAIEAELPDWVKDMAPSATGFAEAQQDEDSPDLEAMFDKQDGPDSGDTPDWLSSIEDEGSPELAIPSEDQELPDWLDSGGDEAPEQVKETSVRSEEDLPELLDATAEETPPAATESKSADDIPDWLKGVEEQAQEDISEEAESTGVTDFLLGLGVDSKEGELPSQPLNEEPSEVGAPDETEGDEIPDWLKSAEPDIAEEPQFDAENADDIEWLKDVGDVDEDAAEDEIAVESIDETDAEADTTQGAQPADLPDWLKSLDSAEAAEEITVPVESKMVKEKPPEIVDESVDTEAVKDDSGDIPDWLDDLAEASLSDEGEVEPQPQAADTPDWLSAISEEEPEIQESEFTTEVEALHEEVEKTTPEYMRTSAADALEKEDEEQPTLPSFDDLQPAEKPEQDFPEWLSTPDESMHEEKTIPTSFDESALDNSAFPEWLSTPTEEKPADAEGKPAAEFEDADAAMAWLDDLAEQPDILDDELQSQPEQPAEAPAEAEDETLTTSATDTPDWLKDLDSAEADAIEKPNLEESDQTTAEAVEAAETPDFEDPDAAMAWLEGLAAKQGVSEEELISSPDERPADPPKWAQETAAQDTAAQDTVREEPVSPESPDESQLQGADSEPVSGEITPEDIPEWLQDSAFASAIEDDQIEREPTDEAVPADQVAEEPEAEPVADEQVLADSLAEDLPQELVTDEAPGAADDTPDWLKDALNDAPAIIAAEQEREEISETTPEELPREGEDLPDWLKDVEPESEPAEDATWMREFGKDVPSFERADIDEIPHDAEAMPEVDSFEDAEPTIEIESDEAVADGESLPEWLQDFDDEQDQPEPVVVDDQPTEEEYTWHPTESEQPAELRESEGESAEQVPGEKLDINQASLVELERLPGMGFRKAQTVFSYREEHGAFDKLDDLLLLGIDAETVEGIKDLLEVKSVAKSADPASSTTTVATPVAGAPAEPEARPTPVAIVPDAPEAAVDEHHAVQIGAQEQLAKGNISTAMEEYDKLISKGKRINEIITDLETADQAVPNNPEILQVLGDAYMRADRLQEALDTYSKVEQLLQ